MTSEPHDQSNNLDSVAHGADVESHHRDPGWEVPTPADIGSGGATDSASPPDASPLLEEQVDHGESLRPRQFWNEGAPVSGKTSNSRPIPPQ